MGEKFKEVHDPSEKARNFYDVLYRTRAQNGVRLKDFPNYELEYSVYQKGGQEFIQIERYVWKDVSEWSHIPANSVDVEAVYEEIQEFMASEIGENWVLETEENGDAFWMSVYIPVPKKTEYNKVAEKIMSIIAYDNETHRSKYRV